MLKIIWNYLRNILFVKKLVLFVTISKHSFVCCIFDKQIHTSVKTKYIWNHKFEILGGKLLK